MRNDIVYIIAMNTLHVYKINDESLTDEDKAQITDFIESNFPHGYTFSVRWDERNEFDRFPAFGLPSVTYTVDFVRL